MSKYFNEKINEKMSIGYDYYEDRKEEQALPYFMEVMEYIVDFAKKKHIRSLEELDRYEIVDQYIINFLGDFESVILCSKDHYEESLKLVREYIDVLCLEGLEYENSLRLKANLLFRLHRVEEAERILLSYLKHHKNWVWGYIELVDDFYDYANDKEKAKEYYELGLKNVKKEDLTYLEEREDMIYRS